VRNEKYDAVALIMKSEPLIFKSDVVFYWKEAQLRYIGIDELRCIMACEKCL
jgi:hypothetical protein